jgi:hypothetical protein
MGDMVLDISLFYGECAVAEYVVATASSCGTSWIHKSHGQTYVFLQIKSRNLYNLFSLILMEGDDQAARESCSMW